MTPYEEMMKFEIGLEIGLLSLGELRDFLWESLRQPDVPYVYTDIFLSIDKGQEAVIDNIFYNLRGNYQMERGFGSTVQRALIGVIHRKLQNGSINTAQAVEYLSALNHYFDGDWNLVAVDEYYRLTKSGFHSEAEFNAMLSNIFSIEIVS